MLMRKCTSGFSIRAWRALYTAINNSMYTTPMHVNPSMVLPIALPSSTASAMEKNISARVKMADSTTTSISAVMMRTILSTEESLVYFTLRSNHCLASSANCAIYSMF